MNKEHLESLIEKLKNSSQQDSERNARLRAIIDLGNVGQQLESSQQRGRVVDKLGAILQNREYEVVRARRLAASALGDLKDERAIDILMASLGDRDGRVRSSVVSALMEFREQIPERVVEVMNDEDPLRLASAARALGYLGQTKHIRLLIDALDDESPDVVREAAQALGHLRSDDAVERLIALLDHSDTRVAWTAARALGSIRNERAIQPLIEAVAKPHMGRPAMAALADITHPRAIGTLIKGLHSVDHDMFTEAKIGLVRLGAAAVEPLIKVVQDTDQDKQMRISAIEILGDLGENRAIPAIQDASRDRNELIRKLARSVLDEMLTTSDR